MGNLLWDSDRPAFCERVAKLAGGTTYRDPWTVSGGNIADRLPDAHAIATALSFARRGPQDIGPDVAYCLVLQSDAYRRKVVRMLAEAIGSMDGREIRHARGYAGNACEAAWEAVIHLQSGYKRPYGCSEAAWSKMLLTAVSIMHDQAWDALAGAERCYRQAG